MTRPMSEEREKVLAMAEQWVSSAAGREQSPQAEVATKFARALLSTSASERGMAALDRLRAAGWSVAVHNDYRINGAAATFWLFTHPSGRWVKGEGATDADALAQVEAQAAAERGMKEALEKIANFKAEKVCCDKPIFGEFGNGIDRACCENEREDYEAALEEVQNIARAALPVEGEDEQARGQGRYAKGEGQ